MNFGYFDDEKREYVITRPVSYTHLDVYKRQDQYRTLDRITYEKRNLR